MFCLGGDGFHHVVLLIPCALVLLLAVRVDVDGVVGGG